KTPSQWEHICDSKCKGTRQSPVNIDTDKAIFDSSLTNFTFSNFSYPHSISHLVNTGHTVKCVLENNVVTVKGGGLRYEYASTELHFHWGNTTYPGSEHSVNQNRHLMEMHLVSLRKGLTVQNAMEDPEGIAVLGFFIDGTSDKETPEAWKNLTSHLVKITNISTNITMNRVVSISDLLNGVNLSKFYRYNGSLTTPTCDEAVVWTVFQEPISVSKDLIDQFPETMNYQNIYRPQQDLNGRKVFYTMSVSWPELTVSHWDTLHGSYCGGKEQSPVDIHTSDVIPDADLKHFNFINFSNPHAIAALENTGHTGGLKDQYSTVQVHFHWGNVSDSSLGSEHSVNSKRYPMEVINEQKSLFFHRSTVELNESISLDDLIGNVDRSQYYRYSGSLTTPSCNEGVIWTIFKQPIKVNKNLVKMFPTQMGYINIFRPQQPLSHRNVYTSLAPTHSRPLGFSLFMALLLVLC
ncbi:Transient receptor potential cation channel subfamily M member 4-like, partial [Scleropages formosus]